MYRYFHILSFASDSTKYFFFFTVVLDIFSFFLDAITLLFSINMLIIRIKTIFFFLQNVLFFFFFCPSARRVLRKVRPEAGETRSRVGKSLKKLKLKNDKKLNII